MKRKTLIAVWTLVLALILPACTNTAVDSESVQQPSAGQESGNVTATEDNGELDVLRIGLAALPTQLDPDYSIGIASIKLFYNLFDTLLFTDKDGGVVGRLAESWEWQDDTTLLVRIRDGVTFHNGEVCDAEDVAFTFNLILSGYGDGTIAVLYETLESVEQVDNLTVRFHLSRPDAAFEQRLGSIWGASILPKDYVQEIGSEAFQTAPVGTGPFRLTGYSPEKYILERYDDFWGEAANVRQIEFIAYPEASARLTALITGEVDIINDVGADLQSAIDSTDGLSVVGTPIKNIHIYVFQTQQDNIMSNQSFRQALTMAMDRQLLVDSFWGDHAFVPNGHQFPAYGDLYLADYSGVAYDPERARQLVAESGYDGEEVITIEMLSGYYTNGNQAGEAYVSMLAEIGVKAQVVYTETFSFDMPHIRAWSSASRFDNPLGALWLLFGPDSSTDGRTWIPTQEFIDAGNTLIDSSDPDEQRAAARTLLEVFDTYCPGTYLYNAEDLYGIREGLEWDMTYCENQIMPFRAEDFRPAA